MTPETNSRYALILAGGSGQRFWPISRDALPKQLLKLFGDKTLLEMTVERLEGLVPKENILILTNKQQEAGVVGDPNTRCNLPSISDDNLATEPDEPGATSATT